MIVNVSTKNKTKKAAIIMATHFYAGLLMGSRLSSVLMIDVDLIKNLDIDDGINGEATWDDTNDRGRDFTIRLDADMPLADTLRILAHEMVHVKQYAKGEMMEYMAAPDLVKWQGKKTDFAEIDYWDYPWEIEAYGRELGLYIRFTEMLKIENNA